MLCSMGHHPRVLTVRYNNQDLLVRLSYVAALIHVQVHSVKVCTLQLG